MRTSKTTRQSRGFTLIEIESKRNFTLIEIESKTRNFTLVEIM